MVASKSLILKGIAGFAAACLATAGGFEVNNLLQSSSNSSSLEKNEEDEGEDEIEEVESREGDEGLGVPSGCFTSTTCELRAEELRKIRFGSRRGSSISLEGLNDSDTFELKVEETKETTKYPGGRKYTLKAKETTGTVTIEGVEGDDIVLEKDKGVELKEKRGGGRLEKVPEEVNELGVPRRCDGTCELTKEQLLRLGFEAKDENTSIEVEGLTGKNTVTLTIEEVSEDADNYPKGKKYTLKSTTGTVTIEGVKDGDIVLEKDKGVDFRGKQDDGKLLETVENSLGIPRRCETEAEKCELTKDELQRLKFETEDESSIEVDGLDDGNKVELTIEDKEDDSINYPRGKKYILKSTNEENVTIKGVKEGDIVLEKDKEVVIRETVKGGGLEKALEEVNELGIPKSCTTESQPCELTKEQLLRLRFEPRGNEEITVEGLNEGNKVTLEIGDKESDPTNYPKGKKYTLKSTSEKVTIKGAKNGDIEMEVNNGGVVIRETVKGGMLEEAPEEIDKLGIPTRCVGESPCKLTKEQLLRLRFEAKVSSFAVGGLEENDTVELKVEDVTDSANYPKGKKYTLTSTKDGVTIRYLKKGEIDLGANKGVVIREIEEGGLLEKRPEEVDGVGVPKSCNDTCQLTKEQLRKIKFESKDDESTVWIGGLGVNNKVELTVETSEDTDNYPKSKKYSFKAKKEGVIIMNTKDGDIVLEKDKTFDFREKQEGGKLETVEDSMGIPKSCKAGEVKKGSEPKTCQLTADQLKSLKIKDFGGKADSVTGLTGANKIKLTILWEEESSKYPGNIRYSLDNTSNEDIKIIKGGRNTKMDKNKESWFKNVNGKLALVEAKTKSEVKMKEANEILEKLGLLKKLKLSESDFSDSNLPKHNKKTDYSTKVDDLKKIKFKALNGNADSTNPNSLNNSQKITVYFDWEEDAGKYPNNMKFTFEIDNFNSGLEFKKGGQSVKICKKDTSNNKDNINNIFKVENQDDKWYLVKVN